MELQTPRGIFVSAPFETSHQTQFSGLAKSRLALWAAGCFCLAVVGGIVWWRLAANHISTSSNARIGSILSLPEEMAKNRTQGISAAKPSVQPSSESPSVPSSGSTQAPSSGSANTSTSTSAAVSVISAEEFGAVGDGVTDDTAALQRAFDALDSNLTLRLKSGKVYRHTNVLIITQTGSHVTGDGTLLATNEQASAIFVKAKNVTLDGGLTLKMKATTKRWSAWQQMKLVVFGFSGATIRGVTIDGSAAAGIMMQGASNYLIEDVTVKNTQADGIHNTGASHDGTIRRVTTQNTGDDAVAVVSYVSDGADCYNITVESPRVYGTTGGGGLSVVGGHNITFNDVYTEDTSGAALYIGNESNASWQTYGVAHIKVLGGQLKNSNTKSTVDHGAIMVLNQGAGYVTDDVSFSNMRITNTRMAASRQVSLLNYAGTINHVSMTSFTITGGGNLFGTLNIPAGNYNKIGWKWNGVTQLSHIGYATKTPYVIH